MDEMSFDFEKDHQKEEDPLNSLSKSHELTREDLVLNDPGCKQWSLVRGAKPGGKLFSTFKQAKGCESWVQELFLKSSHGLHSIKIPRHLVSVDEKYLRLCLEAIHVSALKTAPCDTPGICGSSEVLRSSLGVANFVIGYPIASANRDVIWGPEDQCVVGSITESNSMMSILKSPLLQRLGPLSDSKSSRPSKFNDKSFGRSNLIQSGGLSASKSPKPERDPFALRYDGYRSDALQGSPVSITSAESVFTDHASRPSSLSNCQGMLHCRWIGGLPHFEFSVDDQKELYVANAFKTNDKSSDYIYSFHVKINGQYDVFHGESAIAGKMRVSTSFSLCPNNSKVAETEFVLFGKNEGQRGDTQTSSRNGKRSRKLSRVVEVFKTSQNTKGRSPSLFGGASAFEDHIENVVEEVSRITSPMNKTDLLHGGFLRELELAAIVVKDHIQDDSHEQEDTGGWGLKFLRKAGSRKDPSRLLGSEPSCRGNCEACSMSIDIMLPAGFHGRPTNGDGRPSSIIERWKSGGHCDCGGWDIGCPVTILKCIPRIEDSLAHSKSQKDCKSFDIFLKGSASEKSVPDLKVTNVHEGLYFITFPSSLPVLQCFGIAVALVHSQSSCLRRERVQV